MATKNPPANWTIQSTGPGPGGVGELCLWENAETGDTVTLPKGRVPDKATLQLLAMNNATQAQTINDDANENSHSDLDSIFEDIPESAVDRILTLLHARGSDGDSRAEVKVYRIPSDGAERYCATFTPEEFEERNVELIRVKFGGGKYRIRVMATTPKTDAQGQKIPHGGKFALVANQIVEIENPLEPLRPNDSSGLGAASPMIEQLLQQNRDLIQRLESGGAKPQSLMEQLQTFKMMQDIFGKSSGEKEKTLTEQMEEMSRLRTIAKDLAGDSEASEPGMMGMASKVLEMIGPALQNRQQQQTPQQKTAALPMVTLPQTFNSEVNNSVSPIAPTPAQSPEPQPFDEPDMNTIQQLAVNGIVKGLIKQAAAYGDIEPQAEFLYEKMPDEVLEMMILPQWWDVLAEMYPAVVPHQEWFTKLRNRIVEIADEPDDITPP